MEKIKTIEEVKAILDRPLPDEAVTPHPTKTFLSNIKAIYVVERFNEAFGLGGWKIHNEVVEAQDKMIVVKSTFSASFYGIEIPDIFGGNDNPDRGDAYKGACTDALTKIGSYLGVGMDVYKGKQVGKKKETQSPKQVTGAPLVAQQWVAPKSYTAGPSTTGPKTWKAVPKPPLPLTETGAPDFN